MGQKTNPISNRLGIIRGWESNWYGSKKDFASKLIEDNKIRNYLNARINKGGISKIVIERTLGKLIITIHTSKPGIIIGKGGGEVDRIKEELKKLTGNDDVQINILEIRRPETDAMIVADTIARQIENRINFKRATKMAIASALRMGAEGIKVKLSGRLAGAVAKNLNKAVCLYILSVWILITPMYLLKQYMVKLVSKYGSVKARFLLKETLTPTLLQVMIRVWVVATATAGITAAMTGEATAGVVIEGIKEIKI